MKIDRTLKALITLSFLVVLINVTPQIARGQICRGSQLIYIVRDARGVAIDAARQDLQFEDNKWKVSDRSFIRVEKQVPKSISRLNGNIAALETFGMCIFKAPVKLQLMLKGKTMNLMFLVPKLSEYDSRDFLVDSLPFKSGRFEIRLPANADHTSRFYLASGWKRVSR